MPIANIAIIYEHLSFWNIAIKSEWREYLLLAWAMAINSASNEEFPVKALVDQQKSLCCIYYMISKVIFLSHCVKVKYSYQKWMEGV